MQLKQPRTFRGNIAAAIGCFLILLLLVAVQQAFSGVEASSVELLPPALPPNPPPQSPPPSPPLPSAPPPVSRLAESIGVCNFCPSTQNAAWSVGGIEWDTAHTAAGDESGAFPQTCSPVARSAATEELVARQNGTVQRVRQYLAIVYPAGRFEHASDLAVVRLFRSLLHVYQGGAMGADVPLDAFEPTAFGAGSDASTSFHCSKQDVYPPTIEALPASGAVLTRSRSLLYRDLLPCRRGVDCVRKLNRFAPGWLDGVEEATDAAYFEVRRFAHTSYWYGATYPPDDRLRPPTTWGDFLDVARVHGSGWWYVHAPGSGIFYHAGRTLVAPTKTGMFVRLLELWANASRAEVDVELHAELLRVTDSDNVHGLIAKLQSVRDGARTCREASVPHCYDSLEDGTLYADSWTLYDEPYDDLAIRLGRSLGYDTLFYSASYLRPDLATSIANAGAPYPMVWDIEYMFGAEMVDLRRPAQAAGASSAADTSEEWARQGNERPEEWVHDVRERNTLSLRDPLDPARGPSLPCEFGLTHQLACRNHTSWAFADSYPALLSCDVPVYPPPPPLPPGAVCEYWCEGHPAPWATKCGFRACAECRAECATT